MFFKGTAGHLFELICTLVTQRPNIGRYGCCIGTRQLCAAKRRHRTPVFLRVRYPVGDRPGNRRNTALAPQPFSARQVRSQWSSLAVGPMAAFACPNIGLAVENT